MQFNEEIHWLAQPPLPLHTNSGFTELLVRHLVGDVGSHQHSHGDAQLLTDDVGDQLQPLWALIDTLKHRAQHILFTPHPYPRTQTTTHAVPLTVNHTTSIITLT